MKQFKTLFITAALFLLASSSVLAQTKVAYINFEELINAMPELKEVQTELGKIQQKYQEDYVLMSEVHSKNIDRYIAEEPSKTDEENERRVAEIESEQEDLQEYGSMMSQSLESKQTMLLTPIIEKAKATILEVAKAQGFSYVLDSSKESNIIITEAKDPMEDAKDLMPALKKALGII